MSGHSHWAGIKHKKAAVDAKRGKLWSKLARVIIVTAKAGGGDPASNLSLRYAIDKARKASMPATSARSSLLNLFFVPKRWEPERSNKRITVSSLSS